MVVGSVAGPRPSIFDADRVTSISADGGQVISIERWHMTSLSSQAGTVMLELE